MSLPKSLPESWVAATLGDVCGTCAQREPLSAENFTYIDIGSVDRNTKIISEPQQLTGENAPSRARKVVSTGDVLVSMTRPNLNAVALVPEALNGQIASTGFEILRPIIIESELIFQIVRSQPFVDAMSQKVQGALYPAVKSADIREFEFPFPPLAEQKQIAAKLDELLAQVDTIKARLDAIPKILKRFRQSVLAAAVSGRLTEEWREEISTNGWSQKSLGDIAIIATGKTPSRTEAAYWDDGLVPWLTSAATNQPFCEKADQFVTDYAVKDCSLKLFKPGTLLLAMYGEGKTRGQVTELKISAACNQACATITVDESKALKAFVKLRIQENYEETRKAAAGGAQPNLNLNKVREILITIPPLEEQTEIVRRVEQLFAFADQIETRVKDATARVNHLTQSILAKAFRGELTAEWRAQNPDLISGENSAEALLARIRAEKEISRKTKIPKATRHSRAGGNP